MKRKFEELRENLDEFVQQDEYPMLVVGCLSEELAYVVKFLQGLEDKHPQNYFVVFPQPFDDPARYLDGVVESVRLQIEAAGPMRAERGEPPFPPLPPALSDPERSPAQRLEAVLHYLRSLLPNEDEHRVVVGLLPLSCKDLEAYGKLMATIMPRPTVQPWLTALRIVAYDDRRHKKLLLAMRAGKVEHVLTFDVDFSTPALTDALARDVADPSVPVPERMSCLMQLAALDYSYKRYPAALEKYGVLFKYYETLGRGFRHFLQRSLSVRLHRAVFTDWDGVQIHFPRFERGSDATRGDGYVLRRLAPGRYRVSYRGQPAMEFAGGEFDGELPLVKLIGEESELELRYDRAGLLSACIESRLAAPDSRRRWEFSRDAGGHIVEITEVGVAELGGQANIGQRTIRAAYAYSKAGELVKSLDALGGVWAYEYDAFHRVTKQTDPRGYSYSFKYDVWARCVQASGMDGLWWCKVEYFPEKRYTRYTEGENATWEYHYDSDGFVTKIVDPYGGETIRERDPEGRIIREIDAGGRELHWLYNADGAHFARKDRFGYVYLPELEEPRMHNPFARKLPNTAFTRMFADGIQPDDRARAGASRALVGFTPPELSDLARRTFRFQQTDAARVSATARIERDALGRKVREIDARGRIREWQYDATGNVIALRDHDDRWIRRSTTSWNLLGTRYDALGNAMRFRYSSIEQTTGIVDPLGNASAYDYNLRGRLTGVHRHGRLREQYVYDSGDHFVEKLDSGGAILFSNTVHANHFVAIRRLTSGGFHRFDYDERGRITEASTDRCEVKLAFDHAGRRTKDERDGRGVLHRHAMGHCRSAVLARFELVEDARRRGTITISGPADAKTVIHEAEPGVLLRESSNGTTELLQFDEDERLEARLLWKQTSDGAWNTWSVRYSYTPEGDLIRIEDSTRGVTQYEVDAAHRLIAETTPVGRRLTYELDAASNVLAKPGLSRVEIDTGNRLRACEDERFEYDHRDHLSRRLGRDGSSTTYTYDSFDMLTHIERASSVDAAPAIFEYEHDGLGRRTVARTPGYQRTFYWDGDRLAAETLPDGRLRIYSYPTRSALVPIAFAEYADVGAAPESGTSYFVYSDPVGMPLHIEDKSGRVVWWATRIDPYGLVEIHPANELEYNLRWPGHYFDPETGLHCNRYRFYDPRLGRYLQSDPLGYAGSDVNLYAYAANPPDGRRRRRPANPLISLFICRPTNSRTLPKQPSAARRDGCRSVSHAPAVIRTWKSI